ncbi:hypothetical protein SAICODRAFT_24018 [Saitoella complicata NRRL Y-17804]|nr:uncharacterized protein SAICODRAFT_24018 [Saitoella complicata NRRL Y-17804]ODQ54775.1 hypothetical protein SAICODRAFT_24018 [Saitoella complicata NRRL Y-17804]
MSTLTSLQPTEPSDFLVQRLTLFPPAARADAYILSLLSPMTKHRVQLLSLGRGKNWAGAISWLPPDQALDLILPFQNIDVSLGGQERAIQGLKWRGVRRFDEQSLVGSCVLPVMGVEMVWMWVGLEEDEDRVGGWKLHDILPLPGREEVKEWLEAAEFYPTVEEAERRFREEKEGKVEDKQAPTEEKTAEDEEDDDYWDQYNAVTGEPLQELPEPKAKTPALETGTPATQDEDTYYRQYDQIESQIGEGGQGMEGVEQSKSAPAAEDDWLAVPTVNHPASTPTTNTKVSAQEQEPEQKDAVDGGKMKRVVTNHVRSQIRDLCLLALGAGISEEEFKQTVLDSLP